MRKTSELRGRHVLVILLGFFLAIVAVNMVFLTYALRTFPGQQVEKSYLQGLRYNDRLAEKARQDALGWEVSVETVALASDSASIILTFADSRGQPVVGLEVTGELRRPATADDDLAFAFLGDGAGRYRAASGAVASGVWDLSAVALSADGERFTLSKRLIAP